MKIKNRILSAVLSVFLALGTFAAPAAETGVSAAAKGYSSTVNTSVPEISIKDTDFVNYTYGRLNFRSQSIWLYDFCDEMHTGLGNDTRELFFVEMYYGIHAYTKKDAVCFRFYNNCKQSFTINDIKLISDLDKTNLTVKEPTEFSSIDTSDLENGLYKIEMTAECKEKSLRNTAAMYFYVNGDENYLCSYKQMSEKKIQPLMERRQKVEKLIKENGITPENSLSTKSLCFLWHPDYGYNQIPDWIKLADTIVKDEWSNSLKAFAIHEWMVKNLAYDYFRASEIDMTRSEYYNDFSGRYDMYQLKAGVCFDFANVYAAMCRSQGIPAVTLDTPDHTWNAVYLDGRWYEVDLTTDINRSIRTEDITKVTLEGSKYSYSGYCTLNVNGSAPTMLNVWLWTFDKAER